MQTKNSPGKTTITKPARALLCEVIFRHDSKYSYNILVFPLRNTWQVLLTVYIYTAHLQITRLSWQLENVIITFDYNNRYIFTQSVTNQGTENRRLWSDSLTSDIDITLKVQVSWQKKDEKDCEDPEASG